MKLFLYKIWSKFLEIFGDIKIFKFPMWIVYDDSDFAVNGNKILEISEMIEPGSVILRGFSHYADGKFINLFGMDTSKTKIGGDWSHGAIYIGNGKIIHAVAEGVSETNIIEFCECDRIAIFRPKKYKREAIKNAKKFLKDNIPYDFNFREGASSLYCFELAALSFPKLRIPRFNIKKFFGLINKKDVYLAKSFLDSEDFELVFCYNPKFEIDYRK